MHLEIKVYVVVTYNYIFRFIVENCRCCDGMRVLLVCVDNRKRVCILFICRVILCNTIRGL